MLNKVIKFLEKKKKVDEYQLTVTFSNEESKLHKLILYCYMAASILIFCQRYISTLTEENFLIIYIIELIKNL